MWLHVFLKRTCIFRPGVNVPAPLWLWPDLVRIHLEYGLLTYLQKYADFPV